MFRIAVLLDLLDLFDTTCELRKTSCESVLQRRAPVFFADFLPVPLESLAPLLLSKVCLLSDSLGRLRVEAHLEKTAGLFGDLEKLGLKAQPRWRRWLVYWSDSAEYYRLREDARPARALRDEFLGKLGHFLEELSELSEFLDSQKAPELDSIREVKAEAPEERPAARAALNMK